MIASTSASTVSGRRVLLRAGGLVFFVLLAELPGIVAFAWPSGAGVVLPVAGELLLHNVVLSIGLASIFELYECRSRFDEPRLAVAGTVLGALSVAIVAGATSVPYASVRLGVVDSVAAFRLHQIWISLLEASMAIVFLMQREGSRSAETHLRQHALQWRLARRRADEVVARTALMRLEPEVLFETLRDTRTTFLVDPERADASLEALTTYLRAVLQASKATSSTFDAEMALASARLRLSDRARNVLLTVHAEPAASERRIRAGSLTQLLHGWAEALGTTEGSPSCIRVAADLDNGSLRVRVDARAPAPPSVLDPYLAHLAAAAGKAADELVRFHGKGSLTVYPEDADET